LVTFMQHARSKARPLFEAETRETVDLKRLIRTVNAVVSDSPVIIDRKGVRFHATDPGMVALIDLRLKPDQFATFDAPSPVEFGIDMDEVKRRVCEARKGDDVTLAVTDDTNPEMRVTVDDRGMKSTFTIESDTLDSGDKPETDDLTFSGEAVVALDKLKDAVDRMGDSAEFTLREDQLVIESDASRVALLEASDHIHGITLDDGPVTAIYSTDYLEHVMKLKNTVSRVRLRFGDDFPLRVKADRDRFSVAYTLAPRIEE